MVQSLDQVFCSRDWLFSHWPTLWNKAGCGECWNQRCDTIFPERTQPLDMLLVLPTRLDVEINGFNGQLMESVGMRDT